MSKTTSSPPTRARRLIISRVVRAAWGVLIRQWAPLAILSVFTVGLVAVFYGVLRYANIIVEPSDTLAAMRGAPGESILLGLAGCCFAGGAVRATLAGLQARRESISKLYISGFRSFWRVFGILFLSNLGIIVGLILFVVPGLILWARWIVAVPASVSEDDAVLDSLARSARLTEGQRGKILLLGVIGVLFLLGAIVVLTIVDTLVQHLIPVDRVMDNLIIPPVSSILVYVLSYVGKTAIYAELRGVTDNRSAQELDEIFA